MFGRRSYARFTLEPSSAGILRVLRDVMVQESDADGLTVIGREAAAVGDVLTLQFAESDAGDRLSVLVTECRPIVIEGAMRHRLRLRRVEPDSGSVEN